MEGALIGRARELLRFDGRLSRLGFWRGYLWLAIATVVSLPVGYFAIMAIGRWGAILLTPLLLIAVASLAIIVRRLHDRGKSGLWLLPFVVLPTLVGLWLETEGRGKGGGAALILSLMSLILNIWGLVEIGFLRGKPLANRFGEAPASGR